MALLADDYLSIHLQDVWIVFDFEKNSVNFDKKTHNYR